MVGPSSNLLQHDCSSARRRPVKILSGWKVLELGLFGNICSGPLLLLGTRRTWPCSESCSRLFCSGSLLTRRMFLKRHHEIPGCVLEVVILIFWDMGNESKLLFYIQVSIRLCIWVCWRYPPRNRTSIGGECEFKKEAKFLGYT